MNSVQRNIFSSELINTHIFYMPGKPEIADMFVLLHCFSHNWVPTLELSLIQFVYMYVGTFSWPLKNKSRCFFFNCLYLIDYLDLKYLLNIKLFEKKTLV